MYWCDSVAHVFEYFTVGTKTALICAILLLSLLSSQLQPPCSKYLCISSKREHELLEIKKINDNYNYPRLVLSHVGETRHYFVISGSLLQSVAVADLLFYTMMKFSFLYIMKLLFFC